MNWDLMAQLGVAGLAMVALILVTRLAMHKVDRKWRPERNNGLSDKAIRQLRGAFVEALTEAPLPMRCAECPIEDDVRWLRAAMAPRSEGSRDIYDWKNPPEWTPILEGLAKMMSRLSDATEELTAATKMIPSSMERSQVVNDKILHVLVQLDQRIGKMGTTG